MDRRKRERPEIELELALNSVTVIAFMRICRKKSQVGVSHSDKLIENAYSRLWTQQLSRLNLTNIYFHFV